MPSFFYEDSMKYLSRASTIIILLSCGLFIYNYAQKAESQSFYYKNKGILVYTSYWVADKCYGFISSNESSKSKFIRDSGLLYYVNADLNSRYLVGTIIIRDHACIDKIKSAEVSIVPNYGALILPNEVDMFRLSNLVKSNISLRPSSTGSELTLKVEIGDAVHPI